MNELSQEEGDSKCCFTRKKMAEIFRKLKIWFCPDDLLGVALSFLGIVYLFFIIKIIFLEIIFPIFHWDQVWIDNYLAISIMNIFFKNVVSSTTEISVLLMIVIFIYSIFDVSIRDKADKQDAKGNDKTPRDKADKQDAKGNDKTPKLLTSILISSLSVSAIPTGISLIMVAFNSELLHYLSGVEIYMAFAGFSIISVAYLSSRQEEQEWRDFVDTPKKAADTQN